MALTCQLGFHDWRRAYLTEDSCDVVQKCSRCGAVKGQAVVTHEFEWVDKNPCLSQQVCKRCGAIGQLEEKEHVWAEIYEPASYQIKNTCERCGTTRVKASRFAEFIGQEEIKRGLMTLVAAARKTGEPMRHLLLCGRAGMGKVTLAKIIAGEMGVDARIIPGQAVGTTADLASILTNLRKGDCLVIEQIESLRKRVLEMLIPAITDFSLEITVGKGGAARNIRLKLPPFTLIGTTSKPSAVDERLRSPMFTFNFAPYETVEIAQILLRVPLGTRVDMEAATLLAEQSHGCPGEAVLMLEKAHQYAVAYGDERISSSVVSEALAIFGSRNDVSTVERQQIPDDVKMFVWRRDGGRCVKCGSQEKLEYDHIIPLSKGGSNTARNIQLLCERCNRSKGAKVT